MRDICRRSLPEMTFELMMKEVSSARKAAQSRTAWRIDGTLREFAKFEPLNLWFDYPVHTVDTTGILKDLSDENSRPFYERATAKRKEKAADKNEQNRIKFENAVNLCNAGEAPTVKQIVEYLDDIPEKTIRGWIKKFDYVIDKDTHTVIKCE